MVQAMGTWREAAMACALLFAWRVALPSQALSEDLPAKSARARAAMEAGQFQEAAALYRTLSQALPGNPGFVMNLGLALHMAGQDRQAIEQFRRVLAMQPGHVPAYLFTGSAYLGLGDAARALPPLRQALQAEPGNTQARGLLARALFRLDRFEEACGEYRRIIEQEPGDPVSWYGLGKSYSAMARQAAQELRKSAPGSAFHLALTADARLAEQQNGEAFHLYREALAKNPAFSGLRASIAGIYRRTGHADWAVAEQQKEKAIPPRNCATAHPECDFLAGRYPAIAARRSPATPESAYWRARALQELAKDSFAALLKLPESAERHEWAAETRRNLGRYKEAADEWRQAIELSDDAGRLRRELAVTLIMAGDYQAALSELAPALRRDPNSADLNSLYGETLLKMHEAGKSIPHLEKAVRLEPSSLPARANLGQAYLQTGQAAKAIPHLKLAVPSDVDGSLQFQLGRAYQMAGQDDLAKEAFAKHQALLNARQAEGAARDFQVVPP